MAKVRMRALASDHSSQRYGTRFRTRLGGGSLVGVLLFLSVACGPPPPKTSRDPVVYQKPSPSPVNKKEKKKKKRRRDAQHHAALTEMLKARFGTRSDKDDQARFPLPDRKNWTRVRFSMIKHFTGFIYGKDEHSMTVASVVQLKEGDPPTSAACVQRFEETGRTQVSEMGGRLGETSTTMRRWRGQPLVVRTASGEIDFMFKHYDAELAWAGYPAYDNACMIYIVVIPWREDRDLALELRDQWIDAFKKFKPLTESVPYRH